MKRYYYLTDSTFNGEIIREEDGLFERFVYGPNTWFSTKLFEKYKDKTSVFYKKYEEKTKEQVAELISKQIIYYEKLWKMAKNLAIEKHEGQVDKCGKAYILHPRYVSSKFDILDFKIVAILHDIVEDTDVTLEQLTKMGFPRKIVLAIDAITKNENEKYFEYIERVKLNAIARKVKIEDLKHNLDPDRISLVENSESLKKRYEKALKILEN